jgi:hypothetical protein
MTALRAIDHAALSRMLQRRAEECRALAQMMTSAANAASYLRFAETYDAIAEQEDQLARDNRKDQHQKVGHLNSVEI